MNTLIYQWDKLRTIYDAAVCIYSPGSSSGTTKWYVYFSLKHIFYICFLLYFKFNVADG